MLITRRPSPHHSARPLGRMISLIVLHCDAGKSDQGTIGWLNDPSSKVSYHYLIGRDGTVYQFVDEERKAWHAGVSEFDGVKLCNDYSIGVAFANRNDGEEYTPSAMCAMVDLCKEIMVRHPLITKERVTTHAIISPTRKTDPIAPFNLKTFLEAL